MKKHTWIKLIKYIGISSGLALIFLLFYFFILLEPSNNRNWESGTEKLPSIRIKSNLITILDVRDFHFQSGKITLTNYISRTVDINNLEKVWFIVEPFSKFSGVAHTYFVFDFKEEEPIAVSVEARREKGEDYSALAGIFNQYELIYIWGTESDETIRRVIYEKNKLYMYPLKISPEGARNLFLQLAEQTQSLELNPRFYNTLFSNCTNELAKSANRIKPNAVPLNIALFLPGYSVKELYKLGYLPKKFSVDQLQQKYFISDYVQENYQLADFSDKLRDYLNSIDE